MAEVPSTRSLKLGQKAPNFKLPDAEGEEHALKDVRMEEGLVVAFVCNHCPYVVHIAESLGEFATECMDQEIGFVAISSNDVENYPDDAPEKMVEFAEEKDWSFPYLYDESQEVAKSYFAACTPDFFVFDRKMKLVYSGQFDDARPGNNQLVTGDDMRMAIENMLAEDEPVNPQLPSSGCNIKWKKGNEPEYY